LILFEVIFSKLVNKNNYNITKLKSVILSSGAPCLPSTTGSGAGTSPSCSTGPRRISTRPKKNFGMKVLLASAFAIL
jgi:hypothetical protein